MKIKIAINLSKSNLLLVSAYDECDSAMTLRRRSPGMHIRIRTAKRVNTELAASIAVHGFLSTTFITNAVPYRDLLLLGQYSLIHIAVTFHHSTNSSNLF